MTQTFKGSCYCGDIAFTISDIASDQHGGVICHCRTCQKLHTDRSYNLKVNRDSLKVDKGDPTTYADDKTDSGKVIHRSFCGKCGSALYSHPDMIPDAVFIKVGALEDASAFKPVAEIYVESGIPGVATNKDLSKIKHFEGMQAKEVDSY